MEFAVYGSLKSYLEKCRNSRPPSVLFNYHHLQSLTPGGNHSADPLTMARAQRLLNLLQPPGREGDGLYNDPDYYNSPLSAGGSCAYRPTLEPYYADYHYHSSSDYYNTREASESQTNGPYRLRTEGEEEVGPAVQSPSASNLGSLTFLDFLDFSLQIARGMEHLEKMKVSRLTL